MCPENVQCLLKYTFFLELFSFAPFGLVNACRSLPPKMPPQLPLPLTRMTGPRRLVQTMCTWPMSINHTCWMPRILTLLRCRSAPHLMLLQIASTQDAATATTASYKDDWTKKAPKWQAFEITATATCQVNHSSLSSVVVTVLDAQAVGRQFV